jgi:hypothetical protein
MADILFCKGFEDHIEVTETESRAWHEYDTYTVSCSKCGAMENKVLARRPTQTLLRCASEGDNQ